MFCVAHIYFLFWSCTPFSILVYIMCNLVCKAILRICFITWQVLIQGKKPKETHKMPEAGYISSFNKFVIKKMQIQLCKGGNVPLHQSMKIYISIGACIIIHTQREIKWDSKYFTLVMQQNKWNHQSPNKRVKRIKNRDSFNHNKLEIPKEILGEL